MSSLTTCLGRQDYKAALLWQLCVTICLVVGLVKSLLELLAHFELFFVVLLGQRNLSCVYDGPNVRSTIGRSCRELVPFDFKTLVLVVVDHFFEGLNVRLLGQNGLCNLIGEVFESIGGTMYAAIRVHLSLGEHGWPQRAYVGHKDKEGLARHLLSRLLDASRSVPSKHNDDPILEWRASECYGCILGRRINDFNLLVVCHNCQY